MIDIKEYVEQKKIEYGIKDTNFNFSLSVLLVDNNWFGIKPISKDGVVYVDDSFVKANDNKINEFCRYYNLPIKEKKDIILSKLKDSFPQTYEYFIEFSKSNDLINSKYKSCVIDVPNTPYKQLTDECMYYIGDYMLYGLAGELAMSTNKELNDFMVSSSSSITYAYQVVLSGFIAWVNHNYKTIYTEIYKIKTEVVDNPTSTAYDANEYLNIIFHLFNEEYIEKNKMYVKAAKEKSYIDTWLFLTILILNTLRGTDIVRIPHPILNSSPEETLHKIIHNEFTDAECLLVLNTVLWNLQLLCLKPNKTKKYNNGETIHFEIPHNIQVHVGKLFAIAEAHSQLSGEDQHSNLIKIITKYSDIKRNMGNDIGELFRKGDLRIRSINKSFMQTIEMLTGSILDIDEDFNIKGYMLASYARSHKAKNGSFAAVTIRYLKDAKMSGFTPEFISRELYERGVLSSIPSTLLSLISGGEYKKLSIKNQTKMIKELNMAPKEVENIIAVYEKNKKRSVEIAGEIYRNNTKENIFKILHNIANGYTASKKTESLCLLSSMGLLCPKIKNCTGCEYEIGTVSTLISMKNELYRLKHEYCNATSELEKQKYKHLALNVVAPSIQELLNCYEEQYGKDELKKLELILEEPK